MAKTKKEQSTFNGKGCEEKAINRLTNLERCFTIVSASIKTYDVKDAYGGEMRCRLIVRYRL